MTNPSIPELLKRLDQMYEKEEQLKKVIIKASVELEQLQEDKSLLQSMIMHQSNKKHRYGR